MKMATATSAKKSIVNASILPLALRFHFHNVDQKVNGT